MVSCSKLRKLTRTAKIVSRMGKRQFWQGEIMTTDPLTTCPSNTTYSKEKNGRG